MNANEYKELLQSIFQSDPLKKIKENHILFQQDNCPAHRSRLVRNWYDEMGNPVLNWPQQSPNLNLIEHVLAKIKRELHLKEITSVATLFKAVENIWCSIPSEFLQNLVQSVPRRLKETTAANGRNTKYYRKAMFLNID